MQRKDHRWIQRDSEIERGRERKRQIVTVRQCSERETKLEGEGERERVRRCRERNTYG